MGNKQKPAASIRAIADAMPYTHAEVRKILDGISADARKHGLMVVDNLDGTMGLAAAPAPVVPEGDVVVSWNEDGQIVAVTRQDSEGRILSVIAESAAPVVPLTDEQILRQWDRISVITESGKRRVAFARAIEKAHGIGGGNG